MEYEFCVFELIDILYSESEIRKQKLSNILTEINHLKSSVEHNFIEFQPYLKDLNNPAFEPWKDVYEYFRQNSVTKNMDKLIKQMKCYNNFIEVKDSPAENIPKWDDICKKQSYPLSEEYQESTLNQLDFPPTQIPICSDIQAK